MSTLTPRRGRLLTLKQAGEYLNVSQRWMRRTVEERRLPFVKQGKLLYFHQADLDAYLSANRVEAFD